MSIPEKYVKTLAREGAVESGVPWALQRLLEYGHQTAKEVARRDWEASGLSFELFVLERTRAAVHDEARRLFAEEQEVRKRDPDKPSPVPNEAIREALETFSVPAWEQLIRKFDREDVNILRSYLDANKEPLIKQLGRKKYYRIFNEEVRHGLQLGFERLSKSGGTMTTITDAYWVAYIHNLARHRNIEGAPRPSVKRSWGEVRSFRAIAESLKTTPYKVKAMFRRMEEVPFEEFDGSIHDYSFWATDPDAYERYCRHIKKIGPYRDPDPFFFLSEK